MKFSRKSRSTKVAPVNANSAREVKKLSQSHPARSREGQSEKMPKELLEKIVEIAREHNLVIFSDEIYDRLVMDDLER